MSVKLYSDFVSQPCRALAIFLKMSGIPHEIVDVNIFEGENRKSPYMDMFPLSTVPGLQDGDFFLGETEAIFLYLANKYADTIADHWYPKETKARAMVDAYLAFHHTGTRGICIKVFMNEILSPMRGQPIDQESLTKDVESLKVGLDKIANSFLKNTDYLCGNELSFADIIAVCEFSEFIVGGRDIFQNPKIKAYNDRVKARLNPTFDEVHAKVYTWRDSLKK